MAESGRQELVHNLQAYPTRSVQDIYPVHLTYMLTQFLR